VCGFDEKVSAVESKIFTPEKKKPPMKIEKYERWKGENDLKV